MSAISQDLEFLKVLVEDFFRRAQIRSTLTAIREESITGWEKWLQIEFASFIRKHAEVKAWSRESSYQLDQRVAEARSKCAVDFIIHQRRKHSHLAVEMKQIKSPSSCVNAMVKDIKKLHAIRRSEFDIRSVWCIGVHDTHPVADILREAVYYGGKLGVEIQADLVYSKKIGQTGYSYTLI